LDVSGNLLTLLHLGHIWVWIGITFTLVDFFIGMNIRSVLLYLKKKLVSFRGYWRAMQDINDRFLDASSEELKRVDDDCSICREKMTNAKKLPCGHLFHKACLRQWIQYQFICPVCRASFGGQRANAEATTNPRVGTGVINAMMGRSFHFNGRSINRWLPNFTFEVVRSVGPPFHLPNLPPNNNNNTDFPHDLHHLPPFLFPSSSSASSSSSSIAQSSSFESSSMSNSISSTSSSVTELLSDQTVRETEPLSTPTDLKSSIIFPEPSSLSSGTNSTTVGPTPTPTPPTTTTMRAANAYWASWVPPSRSNNVNRTLPLY